MRVIENYCSDGSFSAETISKLSQVKTVKNWKLKDQLDESGIDKTVFAEYKMVSNPMMLFLHLDQGVERDYYDASYIPFATPRVNCRAIKTAHVSKINLALQNPEQGGALTSEDYSIFPYEVHVGEAKVSTEAKVLEGLSYRSILNRDPASHNLSGKVAKPVSIESVQTVHKLVRLHVSVANMCV
jgi:hypothetical protein